MSSLIEVRLFHRKATLDDVRAGVSPHLVRIGPMAVEAYMPMPVLQYRSKAKDGSGKVAWSEWEDAPVVREGSEEVPADDSSGAA